MGVVAFTIMPPLRVILPTFPRYCPAAVPQPRFRQNRVSRTVPRLKIRAPINPFESCAIHFRVISFCSRNGRVWKYLFAQVYIDPKALIKVD